MASILERFVVTEYLDHTWTDELVGFALTVMPPADARLAIADEKGALRPCQLSTTGAVPQVWFTISGLCS